MVTYTIAASGGCAAVTAQANVTVHELVATSVVDSVDCYGNANGAINISITGGAPFQPPNLYNYSWATLGNLGNNSLNSEDLTGLIAGTYTCTISDANGCQTIHEKIVIEPDDLTASASTLIFNGYGVSCNGGSNGQITVLKTGGVSPYTYSINGGVYQSSNIF